MIVALAMEDEPEEADNTQALARVLALLQWAVSRIVLKVTA
jgi:hypothetical protein